jgi:hypothetical protein
MTRYTPILKYWCKGISVPEMKESLYGKYVLASEADERIKALERNLEIATKCIEYYWPVGSWCVKCGQDIHIDSSNPFIRATPCKDNEYGCDRVREFFSERIGRRANEDGGV